MKVHGKRRSGNKTLKAILVECAQFANKNQNTFFYAQYQRLVVKRGKNRAKVVVAHSMLIAIYYMLKENKEYTELGAEFYNKFNKEKKVDAYMKKIKELGDTMYKCKLFSFHSSNYFINVFLKYLEFKVKVWYKYILSSAK